MSHAVMSQRTEPKGSLDDFPTPPWATRALFEHIVTGKLGNMSCLEPACGEGHMAKVLGEYFNEVRASDIVSYGFGGVNDFLAPNQLLKNYDWVITNPPFKTAEKFIEKSLKISKVGVAMLVRTVFLESIGRYERLFQNTPPSIFAQFVERVPMVKGRLDRRASTATGYSWLVWEKNNTQAPLLKWIPPCRRVLERDADYPESNLFNYLKN